MSLENYRSTMMGCSKCSYCKFIPLAKVQSIKYSCGCPSVDFYGFHTYSGGGRLTAALSFLDGRSSYTEEVKNMVYQCQLCGNCDVTCKVCRYNMEVQGALEEIRARLVEDGQTLPVHDLAIENLRKENNMVMKPGAGRGDWAKGLGLKDLKNEQCDTMFFAGCRPSFDRDAQKTAMAAVRVLNHAGVNPGIMGDAEICCGSAAYNLGYRDDFLRQAAANISALKKAGVKTIVTSCANCYWAFVRLYNRIDGFDIEVMHTVQLAEKLIKEGKLRFTKEVPLKVTYHDPCRLGRLGEPHVPWDGEVTEVFNIIPKHTPPKPRYNGAWGIYDPPREILKAIPGLSLIEMERSRESSWCCGAGAGVGAAFPDFNSKTVQDRIEEAEGTGADALATACPLCGLNFTEAITEKGSGMKVYDVLELAEMAL